MTPKLPKFNKNEQKAFDLGLQMGSDAPPWLKEYLAIPQANQKQWLLQQLIESKQMLDTETTVPTPEVETTPETPEVTA